MIKILCLADLHLTDKKPPCRHKDENWIKAQSDKIQAIARIATKQKCQLCVISGDIFDYWDVPYEFYNKVAQWLKILKGSVTYGKIIAIAGNHDCPEHDYKQLHRTPYQSLVEAEIIHNLDNHKGFYYGDHLIMPFYWGQTEPVPEENPIGFQPIVLAHTGLWYKEKPFSHAKDSGNVLNFVSEMIPSNVGAVIAGDYHQPFDVKLRKEKQTIQVVNCGSMLRLEASQVDYQPTVAILQIKDDRSVSVERFPIPLGLPVSRDHIDSAKEQEMHLDGLVNSIDGDFEITLDFSKNFKKAVSGLPKEKQLLAMFDKAHTKEK